ncbi:MAG: hypothetical protein DRO23_09140 [Thermoprotei archaeon]|nr:MAG: hypothetical protein DRO23_09140 [Thermoprotei archaeon]
MSSPFEKLEKLMTYEELREKISVKYMKLNRKLKTSKEMTVKTKELARINMVYDNVKNYFEKIVHTLPHTSKIHPFYLDLLDVLVGANDYKKSIVRISRAIRILDKIHKECLAMLRLASKPSEYAEIRRNCIGRLLSVLKRNRKYVDFLSHAVLKLRNIPSIDPETPTVIIAGMPQVGKSTLVKTISTAKPKIAPYPFTTKNLIVGHIIGRNYKFQAIDTPGLLDRPLSERNPIELQAILALKHVKGIIVYLFDVSITGYYTLDQQLRVLSDIEKMFDKKIIVALNKVDIADYLKVKELVNVLESRGYRRLFKISALKGIGVKELRDEIISELKNIM